MIFTVILGIVQNLVFIAIMIDIILIIWNLLGWQLGIYGSGGSKRALMITIGILIGIFYLDAILFDIFKVHIVSFPVFII